MRDVFFSFFLASVLTIPVVVGTPFGWAQVMQSPNYRLQSDSVNFGGGNATSANYTLESTGGEVATGESESTNFSLKAGYQQMQSVFISLSTPPAVVMAPALGGITGGTANGSTTVTVVTDSAAGYQLLIASADSPALRKGADVIADYAPGGTPSFAFTTGATQSHFGYSPEGADIVARFRDNGVTCGSGGDTALACWDGLATSSRVIAQGSGANQPTGATTTIQFRVGVGGSVLQPPGIYVATTTLTAVPL